MSKPILKVTADFTKDFNNSIKELKDTQVLVGIPESDSSRSDGSPISNAALLAINNFGSPMNNIPARPVMQIGIKNSQDKIAEQFKNVAQNILSKGSSAIDIFYERAGIIAANSIKKAITDQEGFPGPAASTLRARKAKGFLGQSSLIVTGQMRAAITHVLRKGKK